MNIRPQPRLIRLAFVSFLTVAIWFQAPQRGLTQDSPPESEPSASQSESDTSKLPSAPATQAVTTVDPNVSQAHLRLLVQPLTADELKVEAKAWQEILKANVQSITTLHLRIDNLTAEKAALQSGGSNPAATGDQPADSPNPSPPTVASLTEQQSKLSNQLADLTIEKSEISRKFEIVLASLQVKGGDPTSYQKYINALNGVALEVTSATGLWKMFTTWLVAEHGGKRWAWNLLRFAIILLVSYFGASIIGNFVRRATSRLKGVSQLLVNFLSSFAKQVSMVIGFIVGLAALEIDITPLLAAVGAAGFVVGFALQGTLSNFASGLLILAYRPFDVGDVIEAAGVSGSVDSVSLFSTHVRTFDNKLMIVPNNDIWGGTITNATASDTRRVDLVFGIGYSDDIEQARDILKRTVENHPLVLEEPAANIKVNELADSSVNLICRPWTLTENYWSVYWDLIQTVKQEFDREGISIPFPQSDVHIHQQADTAGQ